MRPELILLVQLLTEQRVQSGRQDRTTYKNWAEQPIELLDCHNVGGHISPCSNPIHLHCPCFRVEIAAQKKSHVRLHLRKPELKHCRLEYFPGIILYPPAIPVVRSLYTDFINARSASTWNPTTYLLPPSQIIGIVVKMFVNLRPSFV